MQTIAILDTETTGKDSLKDYLIEVAIATFDVRAGRLIDAESRLVSHPADIENPAEHVNGIPAGILCHGYAPADIANLVMARCSGANAVVAHNAEFDRQWVPELYQPWICSCDDIEWPRASGSKSLTAIALAHGVGVVYAHRALSDVLTLAHLFERVHEMGHDLREMLIRAARPKATYQALVSYDERDKAKDAGFRWEAGTKRWLKRCFVEDAPKLPFRVCEVSP